MLTLLATSGQDPEEELAKKPKTYVARSNSRSNEGKADTVVEKVTKFEDKRLHSPHSMIL